MKTPEEIAAANQWHSYMRGWKHGAGVKAMDPTFTGHSDVALRAAYEKGYTEARAAYNAAGARASELYGYEPSILRLQTVEAEPG